MKIITSVYMVFVLSLPCFFYAADHKQQQEDYRRRQAIFEALKKEQKAARAAELAQNRRKQPDATIPNCKRGVIHR